MARSAGTEGHRVAVIGGTGWVGRHLLAAFAERGDEALALARSPAPHVPASAFRPLDLTTARPADIAGLLRDERVDTVVNATDGANATDGWARSEEELTRANEHAVGGLLTALALLPRRPRLVHIGTLHEYGPVPAGTLIGESRAPSPANPYARSKLAGSRAVLESARAGAADAVVLRLASVCGPYPTPAGFLGRLLGLLRAAENGGGPARVSISDATRDFVDVRDVAEAVVLAARAPVSGRVVNIGSGSATHMRDLVTEFRTVAGLPAAAVSERHGAAPRSLGGDWMRTDVRLAARLLGWRPRTGLRESLRAMWEAR